MVSNVRYRSFKDFNLRGRVQFVTIWCGGVRAHRLSTRRKILFLVFPAYALDRGPVTAVVGMAKAASGSKPADR